MPTYIENDEIWHLTEQDDGLELYAGENDLFLFELDETPSTGYIWNFDKVIEEFEILSDTRTAYSKNTVGSPVNRQILLKAKNHCFQGEMQLKKQRPWDKEDCVKTLTLHYTVNKKSATTP